MKPKQWIQPQLISLARGRPEEAVLGTCKYSSQNGPGGGDCKWTAGPDCDAQGPS